MVPLTNRPRGQTLVLLALTLLLLALMVLMTLAIGMKVKDRIEAQSAADAAAYSEAVVTARAFNAISLMNRAQVSHMVSLAAVQSLISYAGAYRGVVAAAREGMQGSLCLPQRVLCTRALNKEETRINQQWAGLDQAAGAQQLAVQGLASSYFEAERSVFNWSRGVIEGKAGPPLAQTIADGVRAGSPWAEQTRELYAPPLFGKGSLADHELSRALDGYAGGGARGLRRTEAIHSIHAAMGSRGNGFVNGRVGGAGGLTRGLTRALGGCGFRGTVSDHSGSGYWASEAFAGAAPHGRQGTVGGTWGWGCDHGTVTMSCLKMSKTKPFAAHLFSTDRSDGNDQHQWTPRGSGSADDAPPRHTFGSCLDCPGMWPPFVDYEADSLANPVDLWGQPKTMVVMRRDADARGQQDPWVLDFRFNLGAAGPGSGLNLREPLSSSMFAIATGLTYYHRGMDRGGGTHWREQPNFFNPWWRATLVAPDVDALPGRQGESTEKVLRDAQAGEAADALKALIAKGYRGLQ